MPSIWSYATTSSSNAVYIFGGTTSSEDWSSRVVQFFDDRIGFQRALYSSCRNLQFLRKISHQNLNMRWTKIGDLATGRNGHGAIISGSKIMIVGGDTDDPNQWPAGTEVWDLENNVGEVIDPSLPRTNYSWGVALFLVTDDFCRK